ncbi:MAG: DPP IV N-terminal domain-containing protein [Bacteroidales bacterium]|jgi:dipeptidyl-peptidase-4|nr:DPP IV N-terminal domain-containing protein [Bacteroidales bacterium]
MTKKTITLFTCVLTLINVAFAQGHIFEIKDIINRKYYPVNIYGMQFMGDSDNYCFTKDGKTLWIGNKKTQPQEMVIAKDIDENLSFFDFIPLNDKEFTFFTGDILYKYNMETKQKTVITKLQQTENTSAFELANNNIAYVYEDNVWIATPQYNKQVTKDGNKKGGIVYGQAVHRNEFGINKGFFFSDKGNKLAFYRMDESMVAEYPLVNTAAREGEEVPIRYPMAGMKSHEVLIMIYDLQMQKLVTLKTRKNESIEEREMYLTNISWSVDEQTVYVQKLNRKQNHLWLEAYDANTGELKKVLFDEISNKYVEPEKPIVFLPKTPTQFLFFSERDGFQHLYLYDINGSLVKQLTKGKWMVTEVCGFNAKGDEIFFYGTKDSPLEHNLYGVNLKSGKIIRYTKESGTHYVAINKKGDLFLDSYSNKETPSVTILTDNNGKVLQTLNRSENPLADVALPSIELGTLQIENGIDLYYRMIKPHDFNPNKKYPVIVYVYGGPHAQLVTNNWLCGGNLFFLFLAQQGYIVWTIDSRGSANRGFDFESAIWHNCGSIEVADQMTGVNYLKSLPYIDSTRIGIDGWSYGGFMTISLMLKNSGVFKTATAGGPVIDWKWYEIMYGERYMGTPEDNNEGYENASLLNYVDNLTGKLLVIHGAQDNTVVMQHSLEFIKTCIKHGKQVDYFIYPDHEHNVRGKDRLHLYQKIFDYHKANL